ncbi:hypothetical protein LVJ83_08935 [Uruburuella testudinis]|uniref:Exporter n=1 Tax=Uruburuella testudinis TaxID=1282863 RepID=A0ABY4DSV9_9NEIS|nr:hypothetical protein [Uruburuella testudinis]UOO81099.1 hypothetical protein LVJ83_08935 [Uruburuella testudinis]
MTRKSRVIYTFFIALAAVFVCYTLAARPWLQTGLTALLPQEQRPDVLLQAADKANEAQANGQVVLLAGSAEADKAFQTASDIAALWRKSGLFAAVDSEIMPDLAQVRTEAAQLGLAALPAAERALLMEDAAQYFQIRAQDAANPFATTSPLPLDQDWLGFGRFSLAQAQPQSRLQWDAEHGMLFTEDERGHTWVWLRGRLRGQNSVADAGADLLPLLQQSRALAEKQGVQSLSAGGAVFAAAAKAAAERESRLMGAAGLGLTLALLLWVFRSGRVLALTLPLGAGMLTGLAAVLALFGEVHILTIVIGTSLVGMLVDFPLHWLTPSVFQTASSRRSWQAQAAMRHVLPTFAVSLTVTVAGYALLWFTPLPVLRQTAVFSGFALLGAFGATVWWLPPLFARYHNKSVPFARLANALHPYAGRLKKRLHKRGWLVLLGLLLAGGLWRSDWHDDIRQWVVLPPPLLAEAQQIGVLSGTDFGGQYVVVEAADENALLQQSARVGQVLQPLQAAGKLAAWQSLDQWLATASEQQALQNRLNDLAGQPQAWAAMREIGVPRPAMRRALREAAAQPAISLSDGLKTGLGEAWRPLYLGEAAPGRLAAVVRLSGVRDTAAVQSALSGLSGVHWADKRAHLNELFRHTRNQAAWLKLASYALAWLLLWKVFGAKRGTLVLAVPLAAAVCSVAVLGWLALPVSLFAMFGLLLVSAIGVDYAVYAYAAHESQAARFGGLLLAALTTGISFGLLAFSSTPAVASFGLTVAVGVVFNLLFSAWLLRDNI